TTTLSLTVLLIFHSPRHHPDPHSFPTRRSSDLRTPPSSCPPSPTRSGRSRWSAAWSSPIESGWCRRNSCRNNPSSRRRSRRRDRSEEHTSELQSLAYLVCRLLLEKKKTYVRYS